MIYISMYILIELIPSLQVLQFPELDWSADPSALYTFMIVDVDIERPNQPPLSFFHYLATNVQGSKELLGFK